MPYAHHINLSLQRQFAGSLLIEGSYTSNLAHRISGRATSVNEILSSAAALDRTKRCGLSRNMPM